MDRAKTVGVWFGALVLLVAPITPRAGAQTPGSDDLKVVASYRLATEGLNKLIRAYSSMMEEIKKDPRYQAQMKAEAELKALKAKDETTEADDKRIADLEEQLEQMKEKNKDVGLAMNGQTIKEMEAGVQKFAPLANALRREGLSANEYSVMMLALMQSSVTAGLMKSGVKVDQSKLSETQLANARFILEHEADFKKLQAVGNPSDK